METKFLKNLSLSFSSSFETRLHDPLSRDDSKHPFFESETMESVNSRVEGKYNIFFYSCERRKRRRALEIHYGSIYESEITRSITRVLETCASLDGETCSSFDSRRFIRGRCSPVLRYIFHCTRATLSCIIENRWTICGFLVCGGENDKHGWKGIFARLLYEENFQVRKNDGILS